MRRVLNSVSIVVILFVAMVSGFQVQLSAAQTKPSGSNQDKARACNDQADKKGLKGDDRKTFMQSCLSGALDTPSLDEMSQKDKMNACKNLADKKSLKDADRRSFLKDCMNKANRR